MPVTNPDDGTEMPAAGDAFDPIAQLTTYQDGAAKYHAHRIYADATAREADTLAADGWIAYTEDTHEFWGRIDGTYRLLVTPAAYIELVQAGNAAVGTSLTTITAYATEVRKAGFASHASGVITTPYAGWYTLTYEYRAAVGGITNTGAAFLINGTTTYGYNRNSAAVSATRAAASVTLYLAQGATIALQASRDSAGDISEIRVLALLVRT